MAASSNGKPNGERRRSILDLAPFELDCMNALWPLEEATVRQVQEALSSRRPRAYTTIMTILDRMAQKGVVTRRKVGRTYVYRANLSPADAKEKAIEQVVAGFFGGSREAFTAHLAAKGFPSPSVAVSSSPAPASASRELEVDSEELPIGQPVLKKTHL